MTNVCICAFCTTWAKESVAQPDGLQVQRCEACVAEAFAITSADDPHTCEPLSRPGVEG